MRRTPDQRDRRSRHKNLPRKVWAPLLIMTAEKKGEQEKLTKHLRGGQVKEKS